MLDIIIGPMFSGKTYNCIRLARRYKAIGKSVLFINHSLDTRYTQTGYISTHDGDVEKCVSIYALHQLKSKEYSERYHESEIIIIEEAQFFPDLFQFIREQSDLTYKHFIVCGLAGDYLRKPFGNILNLIPFAEHVTKFNGLCGVCKDGTIGVFTKRLKEIDNKEQIVIGSKDKYECVCRKHYTETLL